MRATSLRAFARMTADMMPRRIRSTLKYLGQISLTPWRLREHTNLADRLFSVNFRIVARCLQQEMLSANLCAACRDVLTLSGTALILLTRSRHAEFSSQRSYV
jgi:hypothetical protein